MSHSICHLRNIIFLICILFTYACTHEPAPFLPETIQTKKIDRAVLKDIPGKSRLQVIIAYNNSACSHTALRLATTNKPAIFWDPGGGYGMTGHARPTTNMPTLTTNRDQEIEEMIDKNNPDSEQILRVRDLVLEKDTPSLNTYMDFRVSLDDKIVELFFWNLTPTKADYLHSILMNGTQSNHPKGAFDTDIPGMFCGSAVSDFLHRFAEDVVPLSRSYFFPHDLAAELYTKSPDQFIIFNITENTFYDVKLN